MILQVHCELFPSKTSTDLFTRIRIRRFACPQVLFLDDTRERLAFARNTCASVSCTRVLRSIPRGF
jgi:hypothetical protein